MKLHHVAPALAALLATPAAAEWMQASTPHFVVYADARPADLKRQAEELELFDAGLRRFQGLADTPDSHHNKLTVFVLRSTEAVQKLIGRANVAGFYVPRVEGSVAFTPREGDGGGINALSPRIVLFHEYAHHFLLGNYPLAFPAWYSEGYAEFASTAKITADTVTFGAAANHRAYSLLEGRGLSAAALFQPPARMDGEQTESLYARGWLLAHQVLFDPPRNRQFSAYLTAVNRGTPGVEAARAAFGDLQQLDRDLDAQVSKPLMGRVMKRGALPAPRVELRPLTPGERALIALRIESTRGVNDKTAATVLARARPLAAPFAGDAVAQGWLAEMAYDAGDDAAADAAADAALAADPRSIQALLYKARVALRRAGKGDAPGRWQAARAWLIKANRIDQDDAATLALYHESFAMAGQPPSKGAIAGLYRAVALAPQDKGVRFNAAAQLLSDGDVDGARAVLRPLAFDPHSGGDNPAVRLLAALDAGKTGPAALQALTAAAQTAEEEPANSPALCRRGGDDRRAAADRWRAAGREP